MFGAKKRHRREFLTGTLAALFSRRTAHSFPLVPSLPGETEPAGKILPGEPGWRDRDAPGSVAGEEADAGEGRDDGA